MVNFSKKYKNTNLFRKTAQLFEETGSYKPFTDYDWWKEEEKRCLHGYKASNGEYITGWHYFALNFAPIKRIVHYEYTHPRTGEKKLKAEKKLGFSKFYDYDAYFFEYCDEAIDNGKFGAVAKARGRGYSYKMAQMLVRNYVFKPGSKGYAVSSNEDFLIRDGLLTKCWDMLNWIDQHTPWGQPRKVKNAIMHKRASSLSMNPKTGVKEEVGMMSEIIGITIPNAPDKLRGIRGELLFFEEAGACPELEEAWQVALPTMEQDGEALGFMCAIGTGSIDNHAVQGLKQLFYKPDTANVYSVPNIWDDGAEDTKCGFYCPQYANLDNVDSKGNRIYMDKDGNTLHDIAKAYIERELQSKIEAGSDSRSIDLWLVEHARCPMESLYEVGGNIFPKRRLIEQINRLTTNTKLKHLKQVGDLILTDSGEFVWSIKKNGDITEYPLNSNSKPEGSIVIWEHPTEVIVPFQYVLGVDSIDFDQADSSKSLGSVLVWKRYCPGDAFSDTLVAEYTGRPETAEQFYENCRKLAMYYHGTIMAENMTPGIFVYFKNRNCMHLLAQQPDSVITDVIKSSTVNRRFGVHMTQAIRDYGLTLYNDKLREYYSPGHDHVEMIQSVPLLQETLQWNGKRNCDRVSAIIVLMLYLKQLERITAKQIVNEELLVRSTTGWNKHFFKK